MKRETLLDTFTTPPTLNTERLILRAMRRQDAPDMFEYAKLREVTRFLLWREHESLAYTEEYLHYIEGRYSVGDFFDWAVVLRENGKMIGTCGFASIDTANNCAQIGYVLNPAYHRRGLAFEAASEVIRFGFEELKLHRIEARFMEGNEPSRKLMEKLGMRFEGYAADSMLVKGSYRTIGTCAILSNLQNKE